MGYRAMEPPFIRRPKHWEISAIVPNSPSISINDLHTFSKIENQLATRSVSIHQGHSARSQVAHVDEVIHSAQATLPNELGQLRLERHQGHSARSQVAHVDQVIHSAQATLPNESGQLRLERHQGHNARSQVAHVDEVIHSA